MNDIGNEASSSLQLETVVSWMLPAWAEACVLYDRSGETTRIIDALRQMPVEQARTAVATWYDAYLNGLYRSLKAWRRGNELGGAIIVRLGRICDFLNRSKSQILPEQSIEAAQTADYLIHLLFALERRWRPYSSRLIFHLDRLSAQGWQPPELHNILLDLITTGDPSRQQALARRIADLLCQRGFGYVYEDWEGQIDQALSWVFS